MRIGVPQDTTARETRVALAPGEARTLAGQGHEIVVEHGAGERASHPDAAYVSAGARVGTRAEAFGADVLTRAQAVDVLSSQSAVAGYRAALIAAARIDKLLPMMTTAAGTIPPARVLALGAGVAGL
ncbi:hypothetical protein B1L11_09745 [Microbispora sp. GKU 823]|nr:hypothetical protein B1L11_09745 [Microbispora sp. GKU 823]